MGWDRELFTPVACGIAGTFKMFLSREHIWCFAVFPLHCADPKLVMAKATAKLHVLFKP